MKKVEEKKAQLLEYLREKSAQGIIPSVREICSDLGFRSTCTAHDYLKRLENEGLIEMNRGTNRNIRLVGESSVSVPLVGTVAAGTPILATENIESYVKMDNMPGKNLFALKVKGESMINIGILSGDTIIVDQTSHVENGEVAVALIEDEATVKTFYNENGRIRLQPENDTMDPIYPETCVILGKVVRLIRDF